MFKKLALSALLLVAFVSLGSVGAVAQTVEANSAANLDQCRNGSDGNSPCVGPGDPNDDGSTGWTNGNAGASNSLYVENQYIPYRMVFSNLVVGQTYEVTIGYDLWHQIENQHAIDYLGTYNEVPETDADPCSGVSSCVGDTADTFPIPTDNLTVTNQENPNTNLLIQQKPGVFTMWGADIISAIYDPTFEVGDQERRIIITFIAQSENPVLAWSGHIAWRGDWGQGNSAGGISGAPYHMRLIQTDEFGGQQDRSLSTEAVEIAGAIFIKKEVVTVDGTNSDPFDFSFTAESNFDPLTFVLDDDSDAALPDTKGSLGIYLFGSENAVRVTEAYANGFTTLDISCNDTNSTNVVIGGVGEPSYVDVVVDAIDADTAEIVTCTFTNGKLNASAAPAFLSGRVLDPRGKGVAGATVTAYGLSEGFNSAKTDRFGRYKIKLDVGNTYVVSAEHKRFTFLNGSVNVELNADRDDVNFQASRK